MTDAEARAMFLEGVRAVAGRRRGGSTLEQIREGLDHLQHGTDLERAQYRGVQAALCQLDGFTTSAGLWCRREEVSGEAFTEALAWRKV